MSEIGDWSLTQTADAVAARKVSSVEVVEAALKRITARQPILNCFVRIDAEQALAEAKAADAAQAAKRPIGPLHGVPLSHKDMYYRAGLPVTCGSAIRRNFVPDCTATVLQRYDAAGAVSIGTLNMSEFANGPTGHNVHFGPTHNPWNPDHITGGSSTGSGTAVAGRLIYGSLGSDTGGSIRLPAGVCGVYGIKPTQGRVSRHGVMGLSFSLDNVGPLARTARDCARLLKIIAGADANDPTAADVPVDDYEAALNDGVSGLRIAVATNHFWDGMNAEIGGILESALGVYGKLGATAKRITAPHLDLMRGLGNIIISSEFCALHDDWMRNQHDSYAPLVRARMKQGFAFSAVDYLKAVQIRPKIVGDFIDRVFGDADVLFLPVLRFPVPTLAETDVKDSETMNEVLGNINHCTWPVNYLGLPGLSVPAGFSKSGLPVGFQLVGRPFAEATLFRVAAAYERETNWPSRSPSLPG
jgi:aspartyl-tRNA(Asn)/glutamyl-tRNA(Gln) amidotransferase subunit A